MFHIDQKQLQDGGIMYSDLTKKVKKIVRMIPKTCYLNYMKYAFVDKQIRKFTPKQSSRRKKVKVYKQ